MFGFLDRFSKWANLDYRFKGTIIRALKAGIAVVVSTLLTAATAGVLFPATWSPLMIVVMTSALQAADKFVREWNEHKELEREALTENTEDTPQE